MPPPEVSASLSKLKPAWSKFGQFGVMEMRQFGGELTHQRPKCPSLNPRRFQPVRTAPSPGITFMPALKAYYRTLGKESKPRVDTLLCWCCLSRRSVDDTWGAFFRL
jgi:hypothetical protein